MAFVTPLSVAALRKSRGAVCTRRARVQYSNACSVRMTAASAKTFDTEWATFAAKMKERDAIPPIEEWHELIDTCVEVDPNIPKLIWLINLMRETKTNPTAVTYEKLIEACRKSEDRVAAFHLVEHMFDDKVKLDDVELPENMDDTLRKILPPEAFE